jgi:hypothetical protein
MEALFKDPLNLAKAVDSQAVADMPSHSSSLLRLEQQVCAALQLVD